MERIAVEASDGCRLSAVRWRASGICRGTVVALPAMMVDARTLDRPSGGGLASVLARSGFDVILGDFRGHGRSDRPDAWTYDDLVQRDVPAMVGLADTAPRFVLGHSLGGHVSAATAGLGLAPIDGLVLLAANVWMPSLEPSRRLLLRKGLSLAAFLATTRLAGRFPARRLGVGPVDEALPYVEDLCRFWREDAWRSRSGVDYRAGLATFDGPVLQVIGAADRLFGAEAGVRGFTEPFPRHEVWVARRGSHGLRFDPDHMRLVTDARAAPLWEAVAGWLVAHADGARASA